MYSTSLKFRMLLEYGLLPGAQRLDPQDLHGLRVQALSI